MPSKKSSAWKRKRAKPRSKKFRKGWLANNSRRKPKGGERRVGKIEKTLNAQSPEFALRRHSKLPRTDRRTSLGHLFGEDNHDIKKAGAILDADHYGLTDVKELILEFLSAIIKRGSIVGSIICLVGPRCCKTSIGQSIADALGRKFFRFSVGGGMQTKQRSRDIDAPTLVRWRVN
ncbi:MAG: hypothetical protein R2788_04160 [Saprospiraceae bacterium]